MTGKPSHIEHWINSRKANGLDQSPILYPNPKDNVIIGLDAILTYLGIRSAVTFYQWVELYGLPAIKRPDGMWCTTMTAIDQWIFMAAEVDNANRSRSRATNARLERAKERLEAQIAANRRAQQ